MKIAQNTRLSLRKLFIAMLAVGPLAVLPSPVWAIVPTSTSFTVNSGSATVSSSGNVANISTSHGAVLQWGAGNFTVGALETWNFVLPAGGAVLNRVGNATTATVDNAVINGTLLSNGKVVILANGGIIINNGATINTGGGLVLSTIREDSDGPFTALGNLTFASGVSTGTISVGTASISGSLHAQGGSIPTFAGSTVTGDLVLKSITAGAGINLASVAATTVGGNMSVTTNAGAITSSFPVKVGSVNTVQERTVLDTGTGNVPVNLSVVGSDFEDVKVTALGLAGDVTLYDANAIRFDASTIGNDLTVTAGGLAGEAAISSFGTLSIGRNANFTQTTTANSGIDIRNNSVVGAVTAGGVLNANTTNSAVRFNSGGNLTTGTITTNTPVSGTLSAVTTGTITLGTLTAIDLPANNNAIMWSSAPTVTIAGGGGAGATAVAVTDHSVVQGYIITNPGAGYTSMPTVTFTGGTRRYQNGTINITSSGALNITGTVSASNNASTSPAINFVGLSVNQSSTGNITTQNSAITINATGGNITLGNITGNRVSVNAPGYNITQGASTDLKVDGWDSGIGGNLTRSSIFNAGTGTVSLPNTNRFSTGTAVIQVKAADATINSLNHLVLANTSVTNNLTVTVPAGKDITIGYGGGTLATNVTIGNMLNLTAGRDILDNIYSPYSIFGGMNLVAGGNITLAAAGANTGPVPTRTTFGIVNASTTGVAPSGVVTLTESTSLNLGNITAASLSAQSITGGIVDSGNLTITGYAAFGTPYSSAGSTVLDNTNHVIGGGLGVFGGAENSLLINSNVSLLGSWNAGNTTLTTTAGKNIVVGGVTDLGMNGNVTLVSGGTIDFQGNVSTTGNLTLTANNTAAIPQTVPTSFDYRIDNSALRGSITRDSNLLSPTWGQITAATVIPGHFLYTTAPTVTSSGGGGAGFTATAALAPDGSLSAINITAPGAGYTGNPNVTLTGGTVNTPIFQSAGSLEVAGTTTINSGAMLWRPNNFGTVVVNNPSANVVVNDVNDLTISGTSTARVDAIAGGNSSATPFPSSKLNGAPADAWSLTLGNLSVSSLYAQASNSGGGNSGTLSQQAGTYVNSYGHTYFTTQNNNITVANNGNSFGRLSVNSNAGETRTIRITEDGTMKIGLLNGRGGTTLISRFGSIIEDPLVDTVITNNGTLTVTANGTNGSINIGNTTHTVGTTTGNVTSVVASAPSGSVALFSTGTLTLSNVTANSLSVEANQIAQADNTLLKIYGASSFIANTGNITLEREGNNFGRLTLVSRAIDRNISIVESGTINLGSVAMGSLGNATTAAATGNGTFTARSVNGDIIDTGLGGAKFGGLIAPAGALNAGAVLVGTGLVSLSAINGNIELNDPTTDFHTNSTGGVVFNAKNVTLAPLGGTTMWLGNASQASVATGNLTATSAIGNISNAGALNVTGDAFFQSGNGDITMTNPSNNFGTVRFAGRNVSISESGHLTIVTGSSATGPATFTTAGGDISIVNRGGTVSLASTALFSASGNITLPKLIQVAGQLTVTAAGTKDLSALSIAGDLGGKTPDNFGSGTYLPPGQ